MQPGKPKSLSGVGGNGAKVAKRPSKTRVVKTNNQTLAAQWNRRILAELQATLKTDPEADLTTALRPRYREVLEAKKNLDTVGSPTSKRDPSHDVRPRLHAGLGASTIFPLSAELTALLGCHEAELSDALVRILAKSEILFDAPAVMVYRISEGIVVKSTREDCATTEHQSLAYLQQHLPSFPAPRPHGMIRFGVYALLFSDFIPGQDLETVWPDLEDNHKHALSRQLDDLLVQLRSLPLPPGQPLGGVHGEGCKDARIGLRVSAKPIMNVDDFEDFHFGSSTAPRIYAEFVRGLMPATPANVCFTHGDIRPANIMVNQDKDGAWKVLAIIDWERCGFYPEYWESVKMTNNLSAADCHDWYLYLPASVSPNRYPVSWLVDRVWDPIIAHRES